MNAYSKDLSMRVLAGVDRGQRREDIVRLFEVSLATIGRWLRRRRKTGEVAPKPSPGCTRRIRSSAEERRDLWAQL
jgi:transposase